MDLNDIKNTSQYIFKYVGGPPESGGEVIVVSYTLREAQRVYDLFVRYCAHAITKRDRSRRVAYLDGINYVFISEAQEELALKGRRNANVFPGRYFEKMLDEWMYKRIKENRYGSTQT